MKSLVLALLVAGTAAAEIAPIPAVESDAPDWAKAPTVAMALHRTPPVYATDPPAALEIASVDVQVARAKDKTLVRLAWKDASADAVKLGAAKKMWQSEGLVRQSEATDRFVDAVAVMVPSGPVKNDVNPGLQMGDPENPVKIYYYDGARGAAVMEARGRGTTRRTGQGFAAQVEYANGGWQAVLELPVLAPGTPVAVALWNGKQQDRDGRKYFTIWHPIR